jgi:N-acetylglucosaminyldiphosphoundecaprenol N-acetyl-beta-D-mannosaminyltransferase
MQKVRILNAVMQNISLGALLDGYRAGFLVTHNVDTIMKMQKDPEFARICQAAEFVVADGQFVVFASYFMGTPIVEKICGSDFLGQLCQHYRDDPEFKVFLLGAMPGVAETAQRNINSRVGRNVVVGTYSPPFGFEKDPAECERIVKLINDSGATVLAMGVGAPKQEKWMDKHRSLMPAVRCYMGIGATIDFEAGSVKRSPRWMSKVGLEWAYRMAQEPKRLYRRYLIEGPPFFWLVLQQRFGRYRDPHGQA